MKAPDPFPPLRMGMGIMQVESPKTLPARPGCKRPGRHMAYTSRRLIFFNK